MTLRSAHPTRVLPVLLGSLGLLVALAGLGSAPAAAEPGAALGERVARPQPTADSYRAYAGGAYTFAVLDNDETSFFSTGPITLCGVTLGAGARQSVYAEIDRSDPSLLFVQVDREASGTVRFTYDACQGDQRATTNVTLTLTQLIAPTVGKARTPGRITATNPNPVPLVVQWGSTATGVVDGRRTVLPVQRVSMRVTRPRVYWVAFTIDRGALVVAGEGTIAKIPRRR